MDSICDQLGTLVSSFGLLVDIVGAILIFKYGFTEVLNRDGRQYFALEQTDEDEALKAKKYYYRARIGLALLIAGFILQLVGHWL